MKIGDGAWVIADPDGQIMWESGTLMIFEEREAATRNLNQFSWNPAFKSCTVQPVIIRRAPALD